MRVLLIALAAAICLGCQTATPPKDYETLAAEIATGAEPDVIALRDGLLAAEDLPARLTRLEELETQAIALVEDEPLKLGSIGSAILDVYHGSLTGHYVMQRFYEHVESEEAELHGRWVQRIRAAIQGDGEGTMAAPYTALTATEARMYAVTMDLEPVGSLYQSNENHVFAVVLQTRGADGPIENLFFDLAGNGAIIERRTRAGSFSPLMMMGELARSGDTAAQASVGGFLAAQNRLDDAIGWLHAASRSGNLAANSMLARVYWRKAQAAEEDAEREAAMDNVLENYLHAVALGSAEAMYALGVLYLNGDFGEENIDSAIPLMQQAGGLGHSDSLLYLAHLYYSGETVTKSLDQAEGYFVQSAALDNQQARLSYARYLAREPERTADPRAVTWLEELADDDNAEAMVVLGNLHARGVHTTKSTRRALRWFKNAIKTAPDNPEIVNEVAWTLTVTDLAKLREERYALKIMSSMMEADTEARGRPEYLDTWAAALAANGDFDGAVEKQEMALNAAEEGDRTDVMEILEEHMTLFKAGQTVTETVP